MRGMGRAILLTGGTGALGRELVRILSDERLADVFVVTRDPDGTAARALLGQGESGKPPTCVRLIRGDVTEAGHRLGMDEADAAMLRARATHVVHCAAGTSFTMPLEQAREINVAGTQAVLDFARSCARIEAIACASTAYVAGKRTGVILETDTSADAERVNSYEQSKHEMENVARDAMSTLPVSLYRFSTIIGHSATGVVTAFNAIHHALRLFYQGLAPMVPGELATRIDLVPVDFAARAMHHLVTRRFEPRQTYHICAGASRSCSLDELFAQTVEIFERSRPAWRKRRIERPAVVDSETYALFVRSVEESGNFVLQRATQAVQAFAWQLAFPKTFDTGRTDAALEGSDIVAPHVRAFYAKVVAFCVETNWGVEGGRAGSDGAAA
jgi:nucleoside-diphosphate-sugar epimerase